MPTLHVLISVALNSALKSVSMSTLTLFILFKIVLGILGSNECKDELAILTVLHLLFHEHFMSSHIIQTSLPSFDKFCSLQSMSFILLLLSSLLSILFDAIASSIVLI